MQLSGTGEELPRGLIESGPETSFAAHSRRPSRLPIGRKSSYGAGQLVELIIESTLNIFVLFYATAVCGLPGGLAGLAIGAGVVIDAVVNPVIGSLSDGWRSRFGRRVPFMVVSLAPILLTFNLIFALPSGLSQTELFLWLMLLSVSLRIALSVFTVPYLALGAELTDDYDERSSVAAWRWGIGIMGTVAVIVLGYGVFFAGPGGVSNRAAYLPLTLTLSAILLAGALVSIRQALAARELEHEVVASTQAIHLRLFGEMSEVFRHRTFRILFAAALLFNIEAGMYQALGLHVITFFWQLNPTQIQGIGMASVLGLVLGAPIAGLILKRIEKRTMLMSSMIGMVACHALPAPFKMLGLLPLTGGALLGVLAVVAFLAGVAMALSIIGFVSIIPDAADEHEYEFGTRREGLYFAGWSFATKTATGIGVLIAGVVLQVVDFPRDISEHDAAAAVSEETVTWLAVAHGPGAALLSLGGIALVLLYRINKRRHAGIVAELAARKSV
ncbi:major facilitator superfamily MFS_1 [Parvibaculum lavamentivorans DS-1]|uniref:Major facilitator superfamily MFS_1 n=1 Tax=Parvibaculum lavamentivorans (strain DS-1 / DSM 13023 / NCIMB 13966) TaxID=402881 RepID=A7HRV8_PARL1|nr:MFS transporter [Parvibaculum lavamentivorans]ABS62641.1 major facilitator superfamily MFS_1 [Parvibaculum lavamentivorans DS-1]